MIVLLILFAFAVPLGLWAHHAARWKQTGRWEWRDHCILADGRIVQRHYYEVYDGHETRWKLHYPYWSEDLSCEERIVDGRVA